MGGLAKFLLLMWVNSTQVMGLVDSMCNHTIIWTSLVESPNTAEAPIYLQCIHGDVWS